MSACWSPTQKRVREFISHHRGKFWSAPFVGSTMPAFWAYCYMLDAYARADGREAPHLLNAMREIVAMLQESELPAAQMAIPALLDWTDVERIWPRIAPEAFKLRDFRPVNCRPSKTASAAKVVLA